MKQPYRRPIQREPSPYRSQKKLYQKSLVCPLFFVVVIIKRRIFSQQNTFKEIETDKKQHHADTENDACHEISNDTG